MIVLATLFGFLDLKFQNIETSHYLTQIVKKKNESIIRFSSFGTVAFEMTQTTYIGLFLAFKKFLMTHKQINVVKCQNNAKIHL